MHYIFNDSGKYGYLQAYNFYFIELHQINEFILLKKIIEEIFTMQGEVGVMKEKMKCMRKRVVWLWWITFPMMLHLCFLIRKEIYPGVLETDTISLHDMLFSTNPDILKNWIMHELSNKYWKVFLIFTLLF